MSGSSSPSRSNASIVQPRIGGMLVGYYVICPRKAWLSMEGLWMEQESATVQLGRQINRRSYARKKKEITLETEAPDGTRLVGTIDWVELKEGVLHETKKSRSMEDAHKWQLRFYLWLLKLNGVTKSGDEVFTGVLNYPVLRETTPVHLKSEHKERLQEIVRDLRALADEPTPPDRIDNRSFCRKCAYEELCYG